MIELTEVLEYTLARLQRGDLVELPCKIGDEAWVVRNYRSHYCPHKGTITAMSFTKDMQLFIEVKYIGCGVWGEKVFATRSEALGKCKELNKQRGGNKND